MQTKDAEPGTSSDVPEHTNPTYTILYEAITTPTPVTAPFAKPTASDLFLKLVLNMNSAFPSKGIHLAQNSLRTAHTG